MKRIFAFYAISGFLSLGYQVVWFRLNVDRFGATGLTFALVVANFIAGLGVGALASRWLADRLSGLAIVSSPLRLYGLLEIVIALATLPTALMTTLPVDVWGQFPYQEQAGIWVHTPGYVLTKIALATALVFVPCFFMGATFPLLCYAFRRDGFFPSRLYAWNTLGAGVGVLACEFLLLPVLGHGRMLWYLIAANAAVGVFFLAGSGDRAWQEHGAVDIVEPEQAQGAESQGTGTLIMLATVGGLLAGSLEGDMFRRLRFVAGEWAGTLSFVSFWAILAIFFASWTVQRFRGLRLLHIKLALGLGALLYGVSWHWAYPIRAELVDMAYASVRGTLGEGVSVATVFPTSLAQLLAFVGLFVFPAYYLVSLLLPWVCNRLQMRGRHVGLAYGLNTLAFCVGLVGFTRIAPLVDVFYSMKLSLVLLVLGVLLVLTVSERRRLPLWRLATAVVAFAVACALTPAGFDRRYVRPGDAAARYPVRALKSNGEHTTYVVADPQGDRLYFDSYSMSGTGAAAQLYMRLMAHFPLLAQENPRKALLIGFGVGNTASAIAAHESIEQLDVVDLNRKVIETAPEFAATNDGVYNDKRIRFIHDDGRNFLALAKGRTYDLITSEPPPPMMAGVYRLYTAEYYRQVLEHLTEQGMMTQWLPVYQMPEDAVDLALRTFVESFPHSLLFSGIGDEYILLGSRAPFVLARIESRFKESDRVRGDLGRWGIRGPVQLLSRIIDGGDSLRRRAGRGRLIRDEHNDLAYRFANGLEASPFAYDPRAVLDYLRPAGLASFDQLRGVLLHLGRLRFTAVLDPKLLATVPADAAPEVALAGADWKRIGGLLGRLAAAPPGPVAIDIGLKALALAPEQPEVLDRLAVMEQQQGQLRAAEEHLEQFRRLEPDDLMGQLKHGHLLVQLRRYEEAVAILEQAVPTAPRFAAVHQELGLALEGLGRTSEALARFADAARLAPRWHLPLESAAWVRASDPDASVRKPSEAIALAERAVELSGRSSTSALDALAAAYASAGEFAKAIEVATGALGSAPPGMGRGQADGIRARLDRYRQRLAYHDDAAGRRRVDVPTPIRAVG